MIFNIAKKGAITQKFLENATNLYVSEGLIGHTGVDYTKFFGAPVTVDNACFVSKIFYPGDRPDNWTAVYTIADDGKETIEICFGHLSRVDVKVGDVLKPGDQVGLEGNYGDVYQGQLRITPEMQRAGDHRGHHVHESWRPVRWVRGTTTIRGVHYLNTQSGGAYVHNGGMYEVLYDSPQTNGCIDPLQYAQQDTRGLISSLQKRVQVIALSLLATLKNNK